MQSPDHPDLEFVQAKRYAKGRPDGPPLWIVVHDMEASETRDRAENTANYFATLPDGRSVSSHYCADNDSVVQCVKLDDTAFTVGNRAGNYRGINWEFSGFASQTRQQWLDEFGRAMFAQAVPYIRADAQRFNIPLSRRTVAELREFVPGVTSHNDLRLAFGVTDHHDPGENFPWDYFMALLEEDMTKDEFMAWWSEAAHTKQIGRSGLTFATTFQATLGNTNALLGRLPDNLAGKLDEILAAALDDGDATVVLPPEAITYFTELRDAVAAVPDAVVDEQAARLAE